MKPLSLLSSSVLDNLGSGVIVFERDLRVSYVNQTAEMLLGVSAKHVLGELPTTWMACQGEAVVDLIKASAIGSPITKRGVVLSHRSRQCHRRLHGHPHTGRRRHTSYDRRTAAGRPAHADQP